METRRDVFQAIADPTRRAIISLIAIQAMTPNAIAGEFDSTRQTISNHIKILQECGLATSKQKGREIYYYIQPRKLKVIADWIEPFRKMWDDRFNRLDQMLPKIK